MPCSNPIRLETGSIVPCSRCTDCKKRRASGWSFRLLQQFKKCESAYFITLTYDTDNVPITSKGYMSLCKRDVQLFIKRVRKAQEKIQSASIKYYAVGEYGGRKFRPHYHIIIFNVQLELMLTKREILGLQNSNFDGKFHVYPKQWTLGHMTVGKVEAASVGYCLKYISKNQRIPIHKNDDRAKEFSLMSKGLGLNYLTKAMKHWHLSDLENRMYCNLPDGKKISMPRYYKDKLYTEDERALIAMFFSKKLEATPDDKKRHDIYQADKRKQKLITSKIINHENVR